MAKNISDAMGDMNDLKEPSTSSAHTLLTSRNDLELDAQPRGSNINPNIKINLNSNDSDEVAAIYKSIKAAARAFSVQDPVTNTNISEKAESNTMNELQVEPNKFNCTSIEVNATYSDTISESNVENNIDTVDITTTPPQAAGLLDEIYAQNKDAANQEHGIQYVDASTINITSTDSAAKRKNEEYINSVFVAHINPTCIDLEDDELEDRLRADIIGNTLYSKKFVLKTLLTFNQSPLPTENDGDFETSLCSIWDMTSEKEVVDFLLCNDFLVIFAHVVPKYIDSDQCRIIEILVGLLANMAYHDECWTLITQDRNIVMLMFKLFFNMDSRVLIQVMRLYSALLQQVNRQEIADRIIWLDYITENADILKQISFILNYNSNKELLNQTLITLNIFLVDYVNLEESLGNDCYMPYDTLIDSTMSAFLSIICTKPIAPNNDIGNDAVHKDGSDSGTDNDNDNDNDFEFNIEDYDLYSSSAKSKIQVFLNIHVALAQQIPDTYAGYWSYVSKIIVLILSSISEEEHLIPPERYHSLILEDIAYLLIFGTDSFNYEMFINVIKIWALLQDYLHQIHPPFGFDSNAIGRESSDQIEAVHVDFLKTLLIMIQNASMTQLISVANMNINGQLRFLYLTIYQTEENAIVTEKLGQILNIENEED